MKKLLFISHAQSDKFFAKELKRIIKKHFVGAFDIFVSSDDESIRLGDVWEKKIFDALERCSCIISLCSAISVKRPWIPFELGYVASRKTPCIPICIRGLAISELPMPLSLSQGTLIDSYENFNALLKQLGNIFDLDIHQLDTKDFKQYIDDTSSLPIIASYQDENEVIYNLINDSISITRIDMLECLSSRKNETPEISIKGILHSLECTMNILHVNFLTGKDGKQKQLSRFNSFCKDLNIFIEKCKIATHLTSDIRMKKLFANFIVLNDKSSLILDEFEHFRTFYNRNIKITTDDEIIDYISSNQETSIYKMYNLQLVLKHAFIILQNFDAFYLELENIFLESDMKFNSLVINANEKVSHISPQRS